MFDLIKIPFFLFSFQLDAKNSPLALLAQTCSAIGADSPNPKLVANMERSAKHLQKTDSRDKSSPSSQSCLSNSSSESHPKSSFKPYESTYKEHLATTPDEHRSISVTNHHRTKTPKQLCTNGRCDSNQSATSPRTSPAVNSGSRKLSSSYQRQPINLEKNASPTMTNQRASVTSKESTHDSATKSSDTNKDVTINYSKALSTPTSVSPFFSAYGTPQLPYPMDLMAASAIMSPHHPMFKAASMNPYHYGNRMKLTSNGAEALACRDPFCNGCSLTSPPHPVGKCSTGCSQCELPSQVAQSKSSYAHQMSAFAHAQLAALAAASQMPLQMPYICSWIGGDATYCGKRFTTSDDLLQHLRTHTASMPESMLNSATAGLPPTHPLFQRTYPTPPLSPMSSNRYHPYAKPSILQPTMPPSLAGLPIHHPSLTQFFSPYSLYGPRLGTSSTMHP